MFTFFCLLMCPQPCFRIYLPLAPDTQADAWFLTCLCFVQCAFFCSLVVPGFVPWKETCGWALILS